MKITSLVLSLILVASAAGAAELDRAAAALAGTEAQFTQRFTPKGFKNSQIDSGSVVFGTLPMMRWTYAKPEQKIFVFDGSRSWFYLPAEKQVTVTTLDEAHRRELPFLLIGDQDARDRNFVVRESPSGSNVVVMLHPRAASALIRSVTITIAAATHTIQRVAYSDRDGNETMFDFSGITRRTVTPDLFRFTPPAGVEVVQQ
ncbi:MAG: outer membrane lipoprotein chaperone LolA [Acidobacteria bacterium]|nr:outer membrane lipoprotein chaperone LolA [Acidobacteriota bacterium]MBV9067661.1 outer membrane lipoprotein chaperone LolA [Acidobacteriota bacterium]MBV9188280.1 outer membrane lipoprotein chaperone LolA [Acidobacteriota bacterium]